MKVTFAFASNTLRVFVIPWCISGAGADKAGGYVVTGLTHVAEQHHSEHEQLEGPHLGIYYWFLKKISSYKKNSPNFIKKKSPSILKENLASEPIL